MKKKHYNLVLASLLLSSTFGVRNVSADVASDFLNRVSPYSKEVTRQYNLYTSVQLAQASLESGWGQSTLSTKANNYFGIKGSYNGQSVAMNTAEYDANGHLYYVVADFKKYPSPRESLADNASLLRNGLSWSPTYYSGSWRENASTFEAAANALTGKYATDPVYGSKLINLINQYGLTKYDTDYDRIVSSESINYQGVIRQNNRVDGVYQYGPYNTSDETTSAQGDGRQYNGQQGVITEETKTSRSTYVHITLKSGQSFWIDKGAIEFVPDKILNTKNVDMSVVVRQSNRVDGIYTDPYDTTVSAERPIEFGAKYNGTKTKVRKVVQTEKSTYVNILLNNKWVWIDQGAVQQIDLKDGWHVNAGSGNVVKDGMVITNKYYIKNGKPLTGEQQIDGKWYIFNKESFMLTGIVKLSAQGVNTDKTAYYADDGTMQYGQLNIGGFWYLFESGTGRMLTGIQNLKQYGADKNVFYGADGRMKYGEQAYNGNWYLFDRVTGAMQYGMQNLEKFGTNKTVYYDLKSGKMTYGNVTVSGKVLTFENNTGALKTGWYQNEATKQTVNKDGVTVTNRYYVDRNGVVMGERQIDGKWYLFDTQANMLSGLVVQKLYGIKSDKTVYYNAEGALQYGEQQINGKLYLFEAGTGAMQYGLQDLASYGGNKTVYYDKTGVMVYGKITLNTKTLNFNAADGSLQLGWYTEPGTPVGSVESGITTRKYYVSRKGVATGEQNINGKWYLFNQNANMITGLVNLKKYGLSDSRTVYYNSNGEMQYGEQRIGMDWYLFDSRNGAMLTGFQNLAMYGGNKTVYYDLTSGKMLYGTHVIDGKEYTFDNQTGAMK